MDWLIVVALINYSGQLDNRYIKIDCFKGKEMMFERRKFACFSRSMTNDL